jgi:hypothetical protein
MTVGRNDHFCIGGPFEPVNAIPTRQIACRDGNPWQTLGEGVNERVNALAFDPNGELYAVGYFTIAGGLPVEHTAGWDGEHGRQQARSDRISIFTHKCTRGANPIE